LVLPRRVTKWLWIPRSNMRSGSADTGRGTTMRENMSGSGVTGRSGARHIHGLMVNGLMDRAGGSGVKEGGGIMGMDGGAGSLIEKGNTTTITRAGNGDTMTIRGRDNGAGTGGGETEGEPRHTLSLDRT
jgi:hypothetical protein